MNSKSALFRTQGKHKIQNSSLNSDLDNIILYGFSWAMFRFKLIFLFLTIISFKFIDFSLCAQTLSIESGVFVGKLIPHTEKFKYTPQAPAYNVEMIIRKKTFGNKAWSREAGLPSYGITMSYCNLGKPREILSDAVAVFPYLEFDVLHFKKLRFMMRNGFGVGYVYKPFHRLSNPYQTAIGSHWNLYVNLMLSAQYQLKWNQMIKLNAMISHFSNGSTQAPNLGINFIHSGISYQYLLNSNSLSQTNEMVEDRKRKPWSVNVYAGYALRESKNIGGPKFSIYSISTSLQYHYSRTRAVQAGIDAELHMQSWYWVKQTEDPKYFDKPWLPATRINLFTGHQWNWGVFSFDVRFGYLVSPSSILYNFKFFNRFVFLWEPFYNNKMKVQPNIGIYLKNHFGSADHLALCLGLRWREIK